MFLFKTKGLNSHKHHLTNKTDIIFRFVHFTENEIAKHIFNFKTKNSLVFDGISTKLLKLIKKEIIKPLSFIVNQCLITGIFPDNLKLANVIPLHKKDNKMIMTSYRPICLLPSISKIIEKAAHNQISHYFTLRNLFYEHQHGFRSKHSTELAALHLFDKITTEMDSNNIPLKIYLDLFKALDTLNHDILSHKLEHY